MEAASGIEPLYRALQSVPGRLWSQSESRQACGVRVLRPLCCLPSMWFSPGYGTRRDAWAGFSAGADHPPWELRSAGEDGSAEDGNRALEPRRRESEADRDHPAMTVRAPIVS
jgi:hypothetical protein